VGERPGESPLVVVQGIVVVDELVLELARAN
jgi:hypothetical protein